MLLYMCTIELSLDGNMHDVELLMPLVCRHPQGPFQSTSSMFKFQYNIQYCQEYPAISDTMQT